MVEQTEDTAANPFSQVPIEITISVGKARPLVKDLLKLQSDSILPLDRNVEDPVELYVGDKLIARGELQELEGGQAGQLAVRLIEVADLKNGLDAIEERARSDIGMVRADEQFFWVPGVTLDNPATAGRSDK